MERSILEELTFTRGIQTLTQFIPQIIVQLQQESKVHRSLTVYDSGPDQVAEEVMSPLGCEG